MDKEKAKAYNAKRRLRYATDEAVRKRCLDSRKAWYKKNRSKILSAAKKYEIENAAAVRVRKARYYKKNKDRLLKMKREYYLKNRADKLEKASKHYLENKAAIHKYRRKIYRENPLIKIKMTCRNNTRAALLSGVIIKAPCVTCGTEENVHAHHENYSKPLEVTWLCREHHFERHRKER